MRHVVGVSDMKLTTSSEDELITHSLGSCIGITIHDSVAGVGALLHFQLPMSKSNPQKAAENPYVYADTGIPAMFRTAYKYGAVKHRITVKVAGGASVADTNGFFQIGRNNYLMMKKIFWKNGILISSEEVGGDSWRTMRMEMKTGRVVIKNGEGEHDL